MSDFQRVKDKETGEELSARRPNLKRFDLLDKPAVDRYGRRLPNKPRKTISAPKKSEPKASDAVE